LTAIESTSDIPPTHVRLGGRTWSAVGAVVGVAALVALLTAFVFLVRAGDPTTASNWPVDWELRNSDNGVIFQLLQDVFAGRRLDWSFSPQVYIFPELPISTFAFVLGGGNLYWYYLLVAAINNTLIFLAIFGVLRMLYRESRLRDVLARACIAVTPLLAFPLIGTSWLVSYHLAPTYYFGTYLMIFGAPMLVLTRHLSTRIVLGVAIVLAAAANPLSLVFVLPAAVAVLVVWALRSGWRRALVPAAYGMGIVVLALLVRVVVLAPLQGTSPLSYINARVFAARLADLPNYFSGILTDPATIVIVAAGVLLSIGCCAGGVAAAVVCLRRRRPDRPVSRLLVAVFLGLVPLSGLAATFVLMITHHLYLWPVLVAPFVIALMAVPMPAVQWLLPIALASLLVIAVATGALDNLGHPERYFGHRNVETECLDANLPLGDTVGYSTFSDARRLSLTSARHFRLIEIQANGRPSYWLTNRAYAADAAGTFFYVNRAGDEPVISEAFVHSKFGMPDAGFTCGANADVLIYTSPDKLTAIETYYRTHTDR